MRAKKHLLLNMRTWFLKKGDILIHDDWAMHVSGYNSDLGKMLRGVGIHMLTLPTFIPELIPIDLLLTSWFKDLCLDSKNIMLTQIQMHWIYFVLWSTQSFLKLCFLIPKSVVFLIFNIEPFCNVSSSVLISTIAHYWCTIFCLKTCFCLDYPLCLKIKIRRSAFLAFHSTNQW